MKYVVQSGANALLVEMEGDFTFSDSHRFRQVLATLKKDNSSTEIHLNIRNLSSIDSTALRLLMMAHDIAKQVHRTLVFVGPKGQVSAFLSEAALHNAIKISV